MTDKFLALMIRNQEGTWDRVRQHQVQPRHVAWYDDHRGVWVPVHGKRDEAQVVFGPDWAFDEYYGVFFWVLTRRD